MKHDRNISEQSLWKNIFKGIYDKMNLISLEKKKEKQPVKKENGSYEKRKNTADFVQLQRRIAVIVKKPSKK